MNRISVLIVDDQELFAQSLKIVLQGESSDITVLGIASNGKEAVDMVEELQPTVILMDIRMPIMDGVEATRVIHKKYPEIKILMLTTFDEDDLVFNALNYGATGYVLKNINPADLVMSLDAISKGNMFVSPSVSCRLIGLMNQVESKEDIKSTIINKILKCYSTLSMREAEVLCKILKANKNVEIADKLCISEKTVKNHISAIYSKLNIHNRLQLINSVQTDLGV